MLTQVTVIMAVFNGENHVEAALNSIASQFYRDFELIVIDDGSSDNSVHVIGQYLGKIKPEFQWRVIQTENFGQGAARNLGVAESKSPLIAFLDQDDIWRDDYLSQAVSKLDANGKKGFQKYRGWVSTNFSEITEKGQQIRWSFLGDTLYVPPNKDVVSLISSNLMMLPSATLFRREAFEEVGGFDLTLRGYEDDDLLIRIFLAGWDFEWNSFPHVKYRIHAGNSSGTRSFIQSRALFYQKALTYLGTDAPEGARLSFESSLRQRMILDTVRDAISASRKNDLDGFIQARQFINAVLKDGNSKLNSVIFKVLLNGKLRFRFLIRARKFLSPKFKTKFLVSLSKSDLRSS